MWYCQHSNVSVMYMYTHTRSSAWSVRDFEKKPQKKPVFKCNGFRWCVLCCKTIGHILDLWRGHVLACYKTIG